MYFVIVDLVGNGECYGDVMVVVVFDGVIF